VIKSVTSAVTVTATFTTDGQGVELVGFAKLGDISGHWAYNAIKYVYDEGLMTGTNTGGTTFSPDKTTTRAELVTVLYRLAGSPSVTTSAGFTDLTQNWYTDAVNWASANDITNGISATKFAPDAVVTREQVVTFFYRYVEYQGYAISGSDDLSAYGDKASLSSFADNAMKWAVGNGIITSTSTSSSVLSPLTGCTRAEIATILQRFCTADFATVAPVDVDATATDETAADETETDAEA